MSSLKLNLLGLVRAYLGGQPLENLGVKSLALLIYLAVERDYPHRREALFTLLWPGMPEKSARHNLNQAVYMLRQVISNFEDTLSNPIHLLLSSRHTLQLNPAVDFIVDIHQLDELIRSTQAHSHDDLVACSSCVESLVSALVLYQGDFLSNFYLEDSREFEEWAETIREAYHRKMIDILATMIDIAIQRRDYEQALSHIDRQLEFDDLNERAQRQKIQVLNLADRRVEAMRQYRLFAKNLGDQLGTAPSQETIALYKRIRTEDLASNRSQPEITTHKPAAPRHYLPVQPTPFIGREAQLADLNSLLCNPDVRLITLIGPGGIGKTRLALAYAEWIVDGSQKYTTIPEMERAPNFPDGIFFIELTSYREVNQIVLAVAESIGVQIQGGTVPENEPLQQLLAYLNDKHILFIFDNFDQLLPGAVLISDLLETGTKIRIIATSRERLQLRQEQLYPVPTLEYREWATTKDAVEFTAVKIFLQAARRIRPDFELTSDDLVVMSRICQLVGGMPLALELSAGWVEILTLAEISREIDRNLDFLATELLDLPDRHRSMRAVFDATWEQLDSSEQEFVQKLSIFQRGFTRQAASHMLAKGDESNIPLHLLLKLASKNILKVNPGQNRFKFHELLRQYAHEQLVEKGGLDVASTTHSDYYLQMLSEREDEIKGTRQKGALDEIEVDFANIQVAWKWALSQGNQTAIDQSITSLGLFCSLRGFFLQGMELIKLAELQFKPDVNREMSKPWRRIAMHRIYLDHFAWLGDLHTKLNVAQQILTSARMEGDQSETALAFYNLGFLQLNLNLDSSMENLESSLAIYRKMGEKFYEVKVLELISYRHLSLGYLQKRLDIDEQQLVIGRKLNHKMTIAGALNNIGFVDEISGFYVKAEQKYLEAFSVIDDVEDQHSSSENIARLGWLAFLKGDFDKAKLLISQGFRLARQFNHQLVMHKIQGMLGMILNAEEQYDQAAALCQEMSQFSSVWAFEGYRGMIYAACGTEDYETAKCHLIEAIKIARALNALGWITQCLPAVAILTANVGQKEQAIELFSLAYNHPNCATGWLEKFPLVVRLRTSLEMALSPQAFSAAWDRGQVMDLQETMIALHREF